MRFDKFTLKAIQESESVSEKYDHQQIKPEHLLMALVLPQEGTHQFCYSSLISSKSVCAT